VLISLAGRQRARIHQVIGYLLDLLVGAVERRARERHQACAGGLEDAEGGDELHEGVDAGGFCGAASYTISVRPASQGYGERWD
jgi:hypothetical protein